MRPPASRHALLALAAALCAGLTACSSPAPVAQVPIDAPKPGASSAPAADTSLATVVALKKPEKLVVDGDVAEWGSLTPEDASPGKGAPQPPSHVAIALDSKGATIAAQVATDPAEGIWVGLSFGEPALPPIGTWLRWGAIAELSCETDGDGQPLDPATVAACKKLLADHEAFAEAHGARFRRFYRIDEKGIRTFGPGGALVPVEGAQAVFKATASGFTAEASLPAKALPRTQQAPLTGFLAVARVQAGGKPPEIDPERWASVGPPEPVGFEPRAALRAMVFEAARGRYVTSPFALSYQPGDDLEMESVGYVNGDTTAVASHPEILYSKQASLGSVEVGYASAGGRALAVIKSGEPVAVVPLSGEPRGTAARGDQLHVFTYDRYSPSDAYGSDFAAWYGYSVGPDGAVAEDLLDRTDVPFYWAQNELVESHLPDFSILEISGHPPGTFDPDAAEETPTIEATWTWSPKEKRYALELTDSRDEPKKPAPKSKPAPKPKPAVKPAAPKPAAPKPAAPKPAAPPKK